jgi:transcriptional regulator with XRE-family HTH domain
MQFGEKLKELRESTGLTQASLATQSGLSLGVVRDYEQGKSEPGFQSLFRLAKVLGVECSAFADCVEEGTVPEPPQAKGRPRKASAVASSEEEATLKSGVKKRKGK